MSNDSTIGLAARLAANLFVNAIELAKPGARLASKIGDRAFGGNPATPQRFPYEDALNQVEEQVDSLDPFYSDGGPTEWLGDVPNDGKTPDGDDQSWPCGCVTYRRNGRRSYGFMCEQHIYRCKTCKTPVFPAVQHDTLLCPACSPINPAGAAASEASTGGATKTAPGPASPVEQAPGPAQTSPSCAGPGATSMPRALQQLDGLLATRSEHPMYAEIQDQADAAVVADVLAEHRCFWNDDDYTYGCWEKGDMSGPHEDFKSYDDWIAHVAPLIIQALQQ